jgi:F0F1-type ATP synthase assembly protein I
MNAIAGLVSGIVGGLAALAGFVYKCVKIFRTKKTVQQSSTKLFVGP